MGLSDLSSIGAILYQADYGAAGIYNAGTITTLANESGGTITGGTNAIYNATGVRMKELPMTPRRVLDALASAETAQERAKGA